MSHFVVLWAHLKSGRSDSLPIFVAKDMGGSPSPSELSGVESVHHLFPYIPLNFSHFYNTFSVFFTLSQFFQHSPFELRWVDGWPTATTTGEMWSKVTFKITNMKIQLLCSYFKDQKLVSKLSTLKYFPAWSICCAHISKIFQLGSVTARSAA